MQRNRFFFLKKGMSGIILIAMLFVLLPSAHAAGFKASDWTGQKTYLDKTTHKLGFGFLNLTAGWTAFFFESCRNDQNFFVGVGKGTLYTFTNTLGGVLHAATFPVPLDIPLPEGGISHEYV